MTQRFKVGDDVYVNSVFGWEEGTILSEDGDGYQVRHVVGGMGETEGFVESDRIASCAEIDTAALH